MAWIGLYLWSALRWHLLWFGAIWIKSNLIKLLLLLLLLTVQVAKTFLLGSVTMHKVLKKYDLILKCQLYFLTFYFTACASSFQRPVWFLCLAFPYIQSPQRCCSVNYEWSVKVTIKNYAAVKWQWYHNTQTKNPQYIFKNVLITGRQHTSVYNQMKSVLTVNQPRASCWYVTSRWTTACYTRNTRPIKGEKSHRANCLFPFLARHPPVVQLTKTKAKGGRGIE